MATGNKDLWMTPGKRRVTRRTVKGGFNQDMDGDGTLGSLPPVVYMTTNWVVVGAAQAQCDLPTDPGPTTFAADDEYVITAVEGGAQETMDAMLGLVLTVDATTENIVVFNTPESLFGLDMTGIVTTMQKA